MSYKGVDLVIAIDGTAASGKGTIAQKLAQYFDLPHLDTGLLYRAVGLAVLADLESSDLEARAVTAAHAIEPSALDPVILGTPEVAIAAAKVARISSVRQVLNQFQVEFGQRDGGAVIDGRDIGTRICPNADVKLYITAEPEVRAKRRTDQLLARGLDVTLGQILAQINERDQSDRSNPAGAFYVAQDAHLLDTSKLSIESAFSAALEIVASVTATRDTPKA